MIIITRRTSSMIYDKELYSHTMKALYFFKLFFSEPLLHNVHTRNSERLIHKNESFKRKLCQHGGYKFYVTRH